MNIFIVIVIIITLLWIVGIVKTQNKRSGTYWKAVTRAKETGKPLLVIGDPLKGMSSGLFGQSYGYGNKCVDIEPHNNKCEKMDAYELLRRYKNNSCVIFCSCVLEYVPNVNILINEIYRVGGGDHYIVSVPVYQLPTHFYMFQNDYSQNIITNDNPNQKITYIKNKISPLLSTFSYR